MKAKVSIRKGDISFYAIAKSLPDLCRYLTIAVHDYFRDQPQNGQEDRYIEDAYIRACDLWRGESLSDGNVMYTIEKLAESEEEEQNGINQIAYYIDNREKLTDEEIEEQLA